MKTSSDLSRKTFWGHAVSAPILALCFSAPTLADAEVWDSAFNGTITAVNGAVRAEVLPGGGGWKINDSRTK
jgi:hypothetical protein